MEIAGFFAEGCWAILPSLQLADGCHLGISQGLSNTLEELLRAYPRASGYFPAVFLCPF
jgi:hypothetical protein